MKTVNGYNVIATQEEVDHALSVLGENFTEKELNDTIIIFRSDREAKQLAQEAKQAKSNLKAKGQPYTLNGVEYQVPLDKDAQDTITTLAVQNMAGLFASTNINFSNGVIMPITKDEFMPFALWFSPLRNGFF